MHDDVGEGQIDRRFRLVDRHLDALDEIVGQGRLGDPLGDPFDQGVSLTGHDGVDLLCELAVVDGLPEVVGLAGRDEIDVEDDVVDDLTNEFFNAITLHKEELGLDASVQLNRIGRFLERIADHAVNLGDGVVFIVTGSFPEDQHEQHTG